MQITPRTRRTLDLLSGTAPLASQTLKGRAWPCGRGFSIQWADLVVSGGGVFTIPFSITALLPRPQGRCLGLARTGCLCW